MSYVTSYIVFSGYGGEEFTKVTNKLKALSKIKGVVKEPVFNEFGDKSCQFSDVRFFAFNYFPDDEFEEWFYEQDFKFVQVLIKKESDEKVIFL